MHEMTMSGSKNGGKAQQKSPKNRRDARLAAQLRANLKRRKSAARRPEGGSCAPESAKIQENGDDR
jgi:hypothetical protein